MKNNLEDLRDTLIMDAREGKITADEAEVAAEAAGLPPFAAQPDPAQFDPMQESRWSLIQAIGWIASRDLQVVMQQGADYRSKCTKWVFSHWRQPSADGTAFVERKGWFLEPWRKAISVRLTDSDLETSGRLPASARRDPREARAELWRALSKGMLIADAFDQDGLLVEVPIGEWSRLELFEENEQDVLKYDALDDPRGRYRDIRFRRLDLTGIWPDYEPVDVHSIELGFITDLHLKPISDQEPYVPLFVALCWIITGGGIKEVCLRDEAAWENAVSQLLPKVCSETIEVIGRDYQQISKPVPAATFDSVETLHPLSKPSALIDTPTHIQCHFWTGEDDCKGGAGDQLFPAGSARPTWTNLKLRRAHVLKLWPSPTGSSKAELECERWLCEKMTESPLRQPNSKTAFFDEAKKRFRNLGLRQFERAWIAAIEKTHANSWKKGGRLREKSKHHAK
jgi:hypothetical protein